MDYKRLSPLVLAILVSLFMGAYFFRSTVLTKFDGMVGDLGDSRYHMLLCDHWYGVFQGSEPVRTLRTYYPQQYTAGYNVTLFAFGIPYSIFCLFGLDMFRAMQLVLILFYVIGSIGMYLLLNVKLKKSTLASILGTAMFVLANNFVQVTSCHTNFYLMGLVPWFFILVYGFFQNITASKKKRIFNAVSAMAVLGITTLSCFNTAYLTMHFTVILVCVLFVFSVSAGENPLLKVFHFVRDNLREVFLYLLTLIVVFLPSMWMYLPVYRIFGKRPWTEVLSMVPTWKDYLNVTGYNLIWGKLAQHLHASLPTGFPLLTLLSFILCVIYYAKRNILEQYKINVRLPLAVGVSIILVMLMTLRVADFTFWKYFYLLIPPSGALRGIFRYNMFLSLPISVMLAFGADEIFNYKPKLRNILFITAITLFVLENTTTITNCGWTISEQREQINNVVPPPKNCKIFVIGSIGKDWSRSQLDAWLIASKYKLHTLNGYGGGSNPPGFYVMAVSPSYSIGVDKWCKANNVTDIYTYDPISNKWFPNISSIKQ